MGKSLLVLCLSVRLSVCLSFFPSPYHVIWSCSVLISPLWVSIIFTLDFFLLYIFFFFWLLQGLVDLGSETLIWEKRRGKERKKEREKERGTTEQNKNLTKRNETKQTQNLVPLTLLVGFSSSLQYRIRFACTRCCALPWHFTLAPRI